MPNETKNMIAFAIIAGLLMIAYQTFVLGPQARLAQAARARAAAAAPAAATAASPAASPLQPNLSRPAALALSPRVQIDTPYLRGSIALRGARVDDLFLKNYHETVDKTSPQVELLRPEGMTQAYFAEQGWVGANLPGMPTPQTLWTETGGGVLSPGHPVVLTYAAPSGLAFTRQIAVDDKAMFTITDSVANQGAVPVNVAPYVSVQRQGLPAGLAKSNIVHEGAVGVLGVDKPELRLANYKSWKKKGEIDWQSRGGWFGITDKYWMTTYIPAQTETIAAKARVTTDAATGIDIYETSYSGAGRVVAPGRQTSEVSHLFAGAKTVPMLNAYGASLGIPRFVDSVDWGNLWFLTKPIFALLEFFYQQVGNFGVAILMLTVVIRLITFPLANKGFEMGVKMKKIQPELQAMQKRLKDDPAAQQKEMMALYQREKVNPVTGCLPILFQIPVFYSLTKLFTVTIEMRHAPFFGWIRDLSAPDPTNLFNLFGLLPFDPTQLPLIGSFLVLGAWPLVMGVTMWFQMKLNPAPPDPAQKIMFDWMPVIFTFMMAQFASGLVIYWSWNNTLSVIQQSVIMRRHGAKIELGDNLKDVGRGIAGLFKKMTKT